MFRWTNSIICTTGSLFVCQEIKCFKRPDQDQCNILIFFTVRMNPCFLFCSALTENIPSVFMRYLCFVHNTEIASDEIWPRPEQDSGLRVVERAPPSHLPRRTGEDPQPHQHRVRTPQGRLAVGFTIVSLMRFRVLLTSRTRRFKKVF